MRPPSDVVPVCAPHGINRGAKSVAGLRTISRHVIPMHVDICASCPSDRPISSRTWPTVSPSRASERRTSPHLVSLKGNVHNSQVRRRVITELKQSAVLSFDMGASSWSPLYWAGGLVCHPTSRRRVRSSPSCSAAGRELLAHPDLRVWSPRSSETRPNTNCNAESVRSPNRDHAPTTTLKRLDDDALALVGRGNHPAGVEKTLANPAAVPPLHRQLDYRPRQRRCVGPP